MVSSKTKEEWSWKLFMSLALICVTLLTSTIGWLLLKANQHDASLSSINSSRCTDDMCHNMRTDISRLEDRLDRLPKEIPPPDFRKKVETDSDRITRLEYHCGIKGK